MTEEQYRDLSDLQLCRAIITLINDLNCFDDPNKTHSRKAHTEMWKIVENLQPKITSYMESE